MSTAAPVVGSVEFAMLPAAPASPAAAKQQGSVITNRQLSIVAV